MLCLLVVFDCVVVAATAVPELASTEDGAICEVEPEVLRQVTLLTLPAAGSDLTARPGQLYQRLSMSGHINMVQMDDRNTWL